MIKVKSNIDVQPVDFEQIDIDYKTDLTVPNQSLSVNDILTNFTRFGSNIFNDYFFEIYFIRFFRIIKS